MKIVTYHNRNPEIEIIEVYGELTGRGAVKFADYLYSSLDEGRRYKIINLANVKKADGLWLNILEYFIDRGIKFRSFNVGLEIRTLLSMSGKGDVIKIYNCRHHDEVCLSIEEEIMAENDSVKEKIMGRRFKRANVYFPAEIKCRADHGDEITYKTVVRNISESGVFTDLTTAFNTNSGMRINNPEIAGLDLSNIRFHLSEDIEPIEAGGECVWEAMERGNHYAGINFKDMKQVHIEMIRDYVHK